MEIYTLITTLQSLLQAVSYCFLGISSHNISCYIKKTLPLTFFTFFVCQISKLSIQNSIISEYTHMMLLEMEKLKKATTDSAGSDKVCSF